MSRLTSIITTDVMLHAAKRLPYGVGTVVELFELVNNSHKRYINEAKTRNVERGITQIHASIQGILDGLSVPKPGVLEMNRQVAALSQLRSCGWEPTLFEGLLQNSNHWENLKRNPESYGKVLDRHSKFDPEKIRIIVELDKTSVLELFPYAFHSLLSDQSRGVPKSAVSGLQDIWGLPLSSHSLKSQDHVGSSTYPFKLNGLYIATKRYDAAPTGGGKQYNTLDVHPYNAIRFFPNDTAISYSTHHSNFKQLVDFFNTLNQDHAVKIVFNNGTAKIQSKQYYYNLKCMHIMPDSFVVGFESGTSQCTYKFVEVEKW